MFGYIIVNKGDMKFKEFEIYHSYYCGLCQTLKERHGRAGQLSLTYDMTFLVMLLGSLYEPETKEGAVKCAAHPEYGADMNVLFAYYKCKDDWEDEKKVTRLAYGRLLKRASRRVCVKYGDKARRIAGFMREFSTEEKRQNQDIDHMAGIFGNIMGEVLAVREDEWQENLKIMGSYLGKFIYLLDAYEDVGEDIKGKRYNPLLKKYHDPDFEEEIRTLLTMMMAGCCREFEKLPIIENSEILRNILYSGIWYRYEMVRQKREADRIKKTGGNGE